MKIAVLLATFNAEKYIGELVDSLLNQTVKDFAIFYHDDGSDDSTLRIMDDYKRMNPERIFSVQGPPTGGAKQNFFYMLKEVEADYYFFCDDDDVWEESKIEKELEAISCSENPAAVFCDLKVVNAKLDVINPTFFSYVDRNPRRIKLPQLLVENVAPGCSMAINRKLRDIAIALNNLDLILMHDHYLMALASATGDICFVDEPLVNYRQTGENEVGAVKVSLAGKIARNLTDIFSGRVKKEKTAFHSQAYDLAKALVSVIDNGYQSKNFLNDFLKTEHQGKFKKIKFYKQNGIDKNSGNLWYYLWL